MDCIFANRTHWSDLSGDMPSHITNWILNNNNNNISCRHNPWKSTASPLYKWLDLAFINQGWHSIRQGTTRVDQVRREATGWIDINPVAWRTQRHLGRHCHQHSRCIIRGNYFSPRRRCRRSRSTAQRNQICWNSANSPFLPVSIRDNGPHQCRWTWVHQRSGSPNLSSHWWPTRDFIFVSTHFSSHSAF